MTRAGNPARRLVALVLIAVLAGGCGGDSTPTDAAPELAEQLAQVDRATTTGDEAQIRERVESLAAATEAARDAGRIDDGQADRILAAADALLARLPAEEPAPEPPSSPTSSPTLSPSPDEDEGDEDEGDGDEGEGGDESGESGDSGPDKDKGKGKSKGKGKKD